MPVSILVADDEPSVRAVLELGLGKQGYDVTVVANGVAAVEQVERTEFDVVVADLRMPDAGGIEVLKRTKTAAPDTEVVIITAHADLESAVECVRRGAFEIVLKPFDVDAIMASIARAVEQRRSRAHHALCEASQAILSEEDPRRLPETIVEMAMHAMNADDTALMLFGADRHLYVAHSRGASPELEVEMLSAAERILASGGQYGPVELPHALQTDLRFAGFACVNRFRSAIMCPLVLGDRVLGALGFGRTGETRAFRGQDVERACILAAQATLAVENKRLLRRVAASERLSAIGQIAAGVAHEINSPLTCLISCHDYLRERIGTLSVPNGLPESAEKNDPLQCSGDVTGTAFVDDLLQALRDAQEAAARIRDIARDLRTLSRNEDESSQVVDLNAAIQSSLRLTNVELRCRAKVVTRLGSDVTVRASAARLSQLFVNLLTNAAHAIEQHRGSRNEIVVASYRSGDYVTVEVSDTGGGIAPENLPHIFEPYFTTKGATLGTGLGLSISRDIVHRYGGELTVESSLGVGATFRVSLPAAKPI